MSFLLRRSSSDGLCQMAETTSSTGNLRSLEVNTSPGHVEINGTASPGKRNYCTAPGRSENDGHSWVDIAQSSRELREESKRIG